MSVTIGVKRLPHNEDLELPKQMTEGSAGADLRAAIDVPVTLKPLERALIPTGLIFDIPQGYEVQVRPRSGLAAKHGITVLNTPGTVDADYRGEIGIILVNLSSEEFTIERGERVAQAIVAPICHVTYNETHEVSETERGAGGFGHTGK